MLERMLLFVSECEGLFAMLKAGWLTAAVTMSIAALSICGQLAPNAQLRTW